MHCDGELRLYYCDLVGPSRILLVMCIAERCEGTKSNDWTELTQSSWSVEVSIYQLTISFSQLFILLNLS